MKNRLFYLLMVLTVVSSCRKDDKSVFDQSPDDRLNATLTKYQAQLAGSQNGWKAILSPAGGRTYSFYFKFNDSNRVRMYADFDTTSAVTLKESSYRLKAIQQPSIIFDTYSYIHLLSDPNENVVVNADVNGGEVGVGLVSDYEFYFDAVTTDTIKLVGRFHGSKAVLIRATSQEASNYNSGQLGAGFFVNRFLTYYKRLTIGTQLFDIRTNVSDRTFTLTYLDASGVLKSFTTGYYLTPGGINFLNPLVSGSLTITGFSNMQFNSTTQTINMTVNNVAATIAAVVYPVKVDLAAPRRWWTTAAGFPDGNYFWASQNGFHVNGIDDAYKINSLVSGSYTYFSLIYWPLYDRGIDFFGPFFLDDPNNTITLVYGAGPIPTFTADGRIIFNQRSTYGTYPASGPAASSRTQLYNTSGYYFVQTGTTAYDMISALDGKSWISWEQPQ